MNLSAVPFRAPSILEQFRDKINGTFYEKTLAERGYIAIMQDKDDHRLQHWNITDKAAEAAEILHNATFAFYDKVTRRLSNDELTAIQNNKGLCNTPIME